MTTNDKTRSEKNKSIQPWAWILSIAAIIFALALIFAAYNYFSKKNATEPAQVAEVVTSNQDLESQLSQEAIDWLNYRGETLLGVEKTTWRDLEDKDYFLQLEKSNKENKQLPSDGSFSLTEDNPAENIRRILEGSREDAQTHLGYSMLLLASAGAELPYPQWAKEEWVYTDQGLMRLNAKGVDAYLIMEKTMLNPKNEVWINQAPDWGHNTMMRDGLIYVNANGENANVYSATYIKLEGVEKAKIIINWCGNAYYPNVPPGYPTEELPPLPPEPPTPPEKEEGKDPTKDPVNQGNADIGGGLNEESEVYGYQTTPEPSFPESYKAPEVPVYQPESKPESSTPAVKEELKNETGDVKFKDSNGVTEVKKDGSVVKPSGETVPPLTTSNPTNEPSFNNSNGEDYGEFSMPD